MFLAAILVCGLDIIPTQPYGCIGLTSSRLFTSIEECDAMKDTFPAHLERRKEMGAVPDSAYMEKSMCISFGEGL